MDETATLPPCIAALLIQISQESLSTWKLFGELAVKSKISREFCDNLGIVSFIASDTKALFQRAADEGVPVDGAVFTNLLQTCTSIIFELRLMLEKASPKRSADISKDRGEMMLSLLTIGSFRDWD
jgi:hypothetical protein